jgi:hypothetical protein
MTPNAEQSPCKIYYLVKFEEPDRSGLSEEDELSLLQEKEKVNALIITKHRNGTFANCLLFH